jgi:hypothetical protein
MNFAVAAALMLAARPRPMEPEPPKGTFREIADGIRYVVGVPWLWISIFLVAFILMIVGMALGSLLFAQIDPSRHRVVIMYLFFALNALFVVAMAVTPWFQAGLVFVMLRGACIGFGIGVWNTLMMQFVSENKLARVSSLDFFGSFALVPVGYAPTALLAGMFAPSALLIAGFSASAVVWSGPLAVRRVREAA